MKGDLSMQSSWQSFIGYVFLNLPTNNNKLIMRNSKPHLLCFFLSWMLCTLAISSSAVETSNFIHFEIKSGGKPGIGSNVVEDENGYLWINSNAGLLRYDGYEFKLYSTYRLFGDSARSYSSLKLQKHKDGSIWAVSAKGDIAKLNNAGKFQSFASPVDKPKENFLIKQFHVGDSTIWLGSNQGKIYGQSIHTNKKFVFDIHSPNEVIESISEGKNNIIWFGTSKGRIFSCNIANNEMREFKGPFNNPLSSIRLITDSNGNLWIGTEFDGVFFYNTKTESYEHFNNKARNQNYIPTSMIISTYRDSNDFIWMGTDGGGLYKFNPENLELKKYKHSKTNRFSLQSNTVTGIGETTNKDIWIFTNYGKVNILPNESNTVGYHSGSISGAPTRVISLLKAKDGKLWIGTDGEGITLVTKEGKTTHQYIAKTKSGNGLNGNYIQAITEDKNGNLWIGTYLNGLSFYNKKTNQFTSVSISNSAQQKGRDVRSIYIDQKDRIWVGSNIGIFVFNTKREQLAYFPHNKKDLQGSIAEVFMEDDLGQFWVGMFGGGICLMKETPKLQESSFTTYKLSPTNNQTESSVSHGYADKAGHLYLINGYGKLVKFDIEKKQAIPIEGFTNDQLHRMVAVQVSDPGNIWVSKGNTISHLNINSGEEHTYTWKNGITKGTFRSGCTYKDQDGILYFGGIEGLNHFDPTQMQTKDKELNLYINKLEIVNRNAEDIIPEQLNEGVEQLKELHLNHNQTSFSFQFSVVNDHLDPNYIYAYRLKGFNDKWISSTTNRIATYTNIPYGDYTFEVKAGSKPNIWDVGQKQISIQIIPPFWKRWWAYAIYAFLFFTISFFIIRYYIMWVNLKNRLLMEELQNEKNKEVYAMKMNFFAKMSHEIQTPLTLILSPIEDMIEKAEGNLLLSQRLQVIKNNATRLSRIAMELMTIRNKEMGRLKIRASENDISSHLNKIALSFMEQARFKKIDFLIEGANESSISLWYDRQKIEHIVYNLLANAFKFTPRDGKIVLSIKEEQEEVHIRVSDTGIGIPKHDLKNIFNLFYQSKDGKAVGGSGIGLALTKELIQLHRGNIEVKSEINKGTEFTISLSKGKAHFQQEEIITSDINKEEKTQLVHVPDLSADEHQEETPLENEDKANVMIVEDNYEMLMFLEDSFKKHYNVKTSQNGQEALDSISDFKPDLILSDVMMPIMDGITLCKELKQKRSSRHIPIILLTTKNATTAKLEGLQHGAIEYMNKPFNVKELLLKVQNILENQKRFIEQYRAEILTESKDIEVESPDEKFIESVLVEMEKHFDDPDFRLEDLSDALNMSYSNIYRKFQALTDKTLVDFMRSFRLRKAESLLMNHNFTISEIAFQVGFNDPKYFSKCFKKEYGLTPKQYKLKNKTGN